MAHSKLKMFQWMVFLTLQRFVCWPTTCEMPSDSKSPKTFGNRSGFFCFRLVIRRLEISKQDCLPSGKTVGDAKGAFTPTTTTTTTTITTTNRRHTTGGFVQGTSCERSFKPMMVSTCLDPYSTVFLGVRGFGEGFLETQIRWTNSSGLFSRKSNDIIKIQHIFKNLFEMSWDYMELLISFLKKSLSSIHQSFLRAK